MKRPDIIFIVLDTQRADRLGCYRRSQNDGRSTSLTPNLDRFAAQAVLFEQAISPAQWTIPSHASMFTGLYPTAHQVTQSHQSLGPDRPHIAEVLRTAGYHTTGFCNNPLVGILNNGFKRGFDIFYNYGGAFPSLPESSTNLPWPLNHLTESYTQFLRRISYPIQNFFGQSDLAFSISLNPLFTPLWSKLANFKGQNERSVKDVRHFLAKRETSSDWRPLFLFLNLMETHLPFWPPPEFVDKVAPYMRRSREAQAVMSRWNRDAFRWQSPLEEPLTELESQVLNDMYDAEVAYQDAYLGPLLELLSQRARRGNTLTLIVADHGDSLGEHGYMGHAFVGYQELVHVPLLAQWPQRWPGGQRIDTPVSSRRVYHTMLDAIGMLPAELQAVTPAEVHGLTLGETINGRDPEQNGALAEIYPPLNFVKAIELRRPDLVESFQCRTLRRAVVRDQLKLIQLDNAARELYDLQADPGELANVIQERPSDAAALNFRLNQMNSQVERQRDSLASGVSITPEVDEHLLQRLRGLGYIE